MKKQKSIDEKSAGKAMSLLGKAALFFALAIFLSTLLRPAHMKAQTTPDGSADLSGELPTTSEPVTGARATSSVMPARTSDSALSTGTAPERATATTSAAAPAPSLPTSPPGPTGPTDSGTSVEPTSAPDSLPVSPAPEPTYAPITSPTSLRPSGWADKDYLSFWAPIRRLALLVLAIIAAAGAVVAVARSFMRGKTKGEAKNANGEEKKCDDVRSLLEQKKKELEDAIRGWPEEKLKAMTKGVIMKEFKKNEDVKGAIEEFERAKKRYDDLKKAIELLERRYDLCMLKLPSATRIKAAIFDLNGVFIQSLKLSERFSEAFHVPAEKFLPALEEVMAKVRLPGAGDLYAYWKPYFEAWGVALTREQLIDFWFKAEKEAVEMTELARELKKKGFKIFILSNNFRERTEYYDKVFPALKEIPEKIYYSWQTGHIKTNEEAHKAILKENDLKPGECIFFDDSEKNVETARTIGIKAFVFKDAAQVREFLG